MTQPNRTIARGIMTGQDPPWMGDSKAEALREAVREAFRPLTLEQLNGAACAVCGATDRPLTPIGVDTTMHTELQCCDRCTRMDLRKITLTIRGDSPLICHNWTPGTYVMTNFPTPTGAG